MNNTQTPMEWAERGLSSLPDNGETKSVIERINSQISDILGDGKIFPDENQMKYLAELLANAKTAEEKNAIIEELKSKKMPTEYINALKAFAN